MSVENELYNVVLFGACMYSLGYTVLPYWFFGFFQLLQSLQSKFRSAARGSILLFLIHGPQYLTKGLSVMIARNLAILEYMYHQSRLFNLTIG